MLWRLVVMVLLAAVSTASCGEDNCPAGYTEVDEKCVPDADAEFCHFTGSSKTGESCVKTADCHGCYLACLEQVCTVLKKTNESCARDAECRSGKCETLVCVE